MVQTYEIIRIVRALSLVNRCVYMRVTKHGCYITRILIGYVLSDARFDWLVYYEQEVHKQHFPLGKLEEFSTVLQTLDYVSGLNKVLSRILLTPSRVWMRLRKHGKSPLLLNCLIAVIPVEPAGKASLF